jgi:hypothetical protein
LYGKFTAAFDCSYSNYDESWQVTCVRKYLVATKQPAGILREDIVGFCRPSRRLNNEDFGVIAMSRKFQHRSPRLGFRISSVRAGKRAPGVALAQGIADRDCLSQTLAGWKKHY